MNSVFTDIESRQVEVGLDLKKALFIDAALATRSAAIVISQDAYHKLVAGKQAGLLMQKQRKKMGMTKKELARYLGIPKEAATLVEAGYTTQNSLTLNVGNTPSVAFTMITNALEKAFVDLDKRVPSTRTD